jgi:hypothetical protein
MRVQSINLIFVRFNRSPFGFKGVCLVMNALPNLFAMFVILGFTCVPTLAGQAAPAGDRTALPQLDNLQPGFTADGAPSCSGESRNRSLSEGTYRIGGRVLAPIPTKTPKALFPDEAREYARSTMKAQHTERFEIASLLRLAVDTDGVPRDVCLMNELGHGFDRRAFDAVAAYRFKPARLDGKPVPVQLTIKVNWSLP